MSVDRSPPEDILYGRGSDWFQKNVTQVWRGNPPSRYLETRDFVPGRRVLELGAAEGTLSLLLAETKEKVYAVDKSKRRHHTALRLQEEWRQQGRRVNNCEMLHGTLQDHLDRLIDVDTFIAVRVIYHLGADLDGIFEILSQHVENIVLEGNRGRALKYFDGRYHDDRLGSMNYYASTEGMAELLQRHGYKVTQKATISDRDPIVIAAQL